MRGETDHDLRTGHGLNGKGQMYRYDTRTLDHIRYTFQMYTCILSESSSLLL